MFSAETLMNYLKLWAFCLLSYVWKKWFWCSEWKSLLKTTQMIWCVYPLFRHFGYKHKTIKIRPTLKCGLSTPKYSILPGTTSSLSSLLIPKLFHPKSVFSLVPSWSMKLLTIFFEAVGSRDVLWKIPMKTHSHHLRFGFLNFLDFLSRERKIVFQHRWTEHVSNISKLVLATRINSPRLGWPSVRHRPSPGRRWW